MDQEKSGMKNSLHPSTLGFGDSADVRPEITLLRGYWLSQGSAGVIQIPKCLFFPFSTLRSHETNVSITHFKFSHATQGKLLRRHNLIPALSCLRSKVTFSRLILPNFLSVGDVDVYLTCKISQCIYSF